MFFLGSIQSFSSRENSKVRTAATAAKKSIAGGVFTVILTKNPHIIVLFAL